MAERLESAPRAAIVAGLVLAAATIVLASAAASAAPATDVVTVSSDGISTINGVEVACTGIGQTRDDPRWAAYPVRVEFANARREYVAGAVVSVSDASGRPILSAACGDSWVLLKLAPGDYKVSARLTDSSAAPRSGAVRAPRTGQALVVLTFPDAP